MIDFQSFLQGRKKTFVPFCSLSAYYASSKKRSTLKEHWSKFFLFKVDLFSEGKQTLST